MKKSIFLLAAACFVTSLSVSAATHFPTQEIICSQTSPDSCKNIDPLLAFVSPSTITPGKYIFKEGFGLTEKGPVEYRYRNLQTGNELRLTCAYDDIWPALDEPGNQWKLYRGLYVCNTANARECPFTHAPFLIGSK